MRIQNRKKWAARLLAGFFALIAVCTFVSRAASSLLVAQVAAEHTGSGKLSYSYEGEGSVIPEKEEKLFLWANQQVESCAQAGENVKAGETLVQFRMDYLSESVGKKQAELTQLKLQLEQQEIAAQGSRRVPATESAERSLKEAQNVLSRAQEKAENAQNEYNACAGDAPEKQELLAEAEAAWQEYNAAVQSVAQAKNAYDVAVLEEQAQAENEENTKKSARLAAEALKIQADEAQKELERLLAYQEVGGKLTAEQDCTVLSGSITPGTVTTGAEVLTVGTGGLRIKAEASEEAAKRLKADSSAEITLGSTSERADAVILELAQESSMDEKGNAVSVWYWYALLPEQVKASAGDTFTWKATAESAEEYSQIIPLEALREDTTGSYCLVAKESAGILGSVRTAERVPVTVLEKDAKSAAVDSTLTKEDDIIISLEKYVEEGDQIRIRSTD